MFDKQLRMEDLSSYSANCTLPHRASLVTGRSDLAEQRIPLMKSADLAVRQGQCSERQSGWELGSDGMVKIFESSLEAS